MIEEIQIDCDGVYTFEQGGVPVGRAAWRILDLISGETYMMFQLYRTPSISMLKFMKHKFTIWAPGTTIVASINGKKEERFAEFFGLRDTGHRTRNGKLYKGEF